MRYSSRRPARGYCRQPLATASVYSSSERSFSCCQLPSSRKSSAEVGLNRLLAVKPLRSLSAFETALLMMYGTSTASQLGHQLGLDVSLTVSVADGKSWVGGKSGVV